MKKLNRSKYLLFIGLGILVFGFLFDMIFINIPPQDAPDYLIKERNENYRILNWIYNTGYLVLLIYLIKEVVKYFLKSIKKRI